MAGGSSSPGMRFWGIGVELAAAVAGLTFLGYWIDRHFGTSPWGILAGAAIGLVGGMYNLIREVTGGTGTSSTGSTSDTGGGARGGSDRAPEDP